MRTSREENRLTMELVDAANVSAEHQAQRERFKRL